MRLDFNVLWVEDQPSAVESQKVALSEKLEVQGFHLFTRMCKSYEEVQGVISDQVFKDEVDLILVDWDLGKAGHGQEVISKIREHIQYKEVVFYSANSSIEDLRKMAFEQHLEGIYCSSREDLVIEVEGVFDSLIKKVLDLDHTRGIVMGATSDVDHIVNECLLLMNASLDEAKQGQLLAKALEYVSSKQTQLDEKTEELKSAKALKVFLDAHLVFTAYDRLKILSGLLKFDEFSAQKKYKDDVEEYKEKVVKFRNELGHIKLVPEGRSTTIITRDGKEVSVDQMREVRRLILRHRKQFRSLLSDLTGPGESAGIS